MLSRRRAAPVRRKARPPATIEFDAHELPVGADERGRMRAAVADDHRLRDEGGTL